MRFIRTFPFVARRSMWQRQRSRFLLGGGSLLASAAGMVIYRQRNQIQRLIPAPVRAQRALATASTALQEARSIVLDDTEIAQRIDRDSVDRRFTEITSSLNEVNQEVASAARASSPTPAS